MLEWLDIISPAVVNLDKKLKTISDFGKSTPYIVNVSTTRTYSNVAPINVFGANVNRFLPNQGNLQVDFDGDYTVISQYGYSDYTENAFLANTMQNPFTLGIIRIETNDPALFIAQNNTINYIKNDPTGKRLITAVTVFRRLNQYANNAVEINLSDLNIHIDGDMQMQFNIPNRNSSYTFLFYPSARASFKILKQTGELGSKYLLPNIPLTPNISIATQPIEIKMYDMPKKAIIV